MPSLRKSLYISLASHLTLFGIFCVSFGVMLPKADYSAASFYGQFLRPNQVTPPAALKPLSGLRNFFLRQAAPSARKPPADYYLALSDYSFRPAINLSACSEKAVFSSAPLGAFIVAKPPLKPSIVFHPLLPYSFPLYFKDRRSAHVEISYRIEPAGLKNAIAIKRKISSGNLEVDLLSMRYISHYLFIQQASLTPGNWQTAKIDLAAEND
jgi:hypothetical protein